MKPTVLIEPRGVGRAAAVSVIYSGKQNHSDKSPTVVLDTAAFCVSRNIQDAPQRTLTGKRRHSCTEGSGGKISKNPGHYMGFTQAAGNVKYGCF